MPTQGRYREVTSTSNCTEFQSRRLRIRQRGSDGISPIATLNGTLCAVTRIIVALLETTSRQTAPSGFRPHWCRISAVAPRFRREVEAFGEIGASRSQIHRMLMEIPEGSGPPMSTNARMIATDLDGTLLRPDSTVSPARWRPWSLLDKPD